MTGSTLWLSQSFLLFSVFADFFILNENLPRNNSINPVHVRNNCCQNTNYKCSKQLHCSIINTINCWLCSWRDHSWAYTSHTTMSVQGANLLSLKGIFFLFFSRCCSSKYWFKCLSMQHPFTKRSTISWSIVYCLIIEIVAKIQAPLALKYRRRL